MKYQQIIQALETLHLPQKVSYQEIQNQYKKLLKYWHPDTCQKEKKLCEEKIKKIIEAYQILSHYCKNYVFSFQKEEIEKHLSLEERIKKQFSDFF